MGLDFSLIWKFRRKRRHPGIQNSLSKNDISRISLETFPERKVARFRRYYYLAMNYRYTKQIIILTLRRPLRRKLRMRWFSTFLRWRSRVFKSNLTDPPSDFWCASFGKYQFKPFQIYFFSDFHMKIMFSVIWFYSLFERMKLNRKRTMFIHTKWPLITSFYIKNVPLLSN